MAKAKQQGPLFMEAESDQGKKKLPKKHGGKKVHPNAAHKSAVKPVGKAHGKAVPDKKMVPGYVGRAKKAKKTDKK